jgi:DNA-binding MarR family transcriptional regulator
MPDSDITLLAEALRPALLRLSRQLRRESQRLGLSPLDALLLGLIQKRAGIGVSELAELELISKPTMSAHIKRLEADGWVERQPPSADDRRRVGLAITPAAVAALDAVRRQRSDWLATRLETLTPQARQLLRTAIAPLEQLAGERS